MKEECLTLAARHTSLQYDCYELIDLFKKSGSSNTQTSYNFSKLNVFDAIIQQIKAILKSNCWMNCYYQFICLVIYSYYNSWMGLYILIFEIFIIIFYGIFLRTGSDTNYTYNDLQAPLYFTLAFTLLSIKYRMYDWSLLTNYLFIVAISFQLNTLFVMFWQSSFYRQFSSTTNITSLHLILNIQCALAILVTTFQFIGRLTLPQIFALSMVQVFAFALNISICQFGIKAITAGGTMTIFLFGFLFAIPIKKFCCSEEIQSGEEEQERYFTQILRLIGLVLCIILWPNFSSTTALVDQYYLITSMGTIYSTAYLSSEAFLHMVLGFVAAIGTTLGLKILGQKIYLDKFINTLLMAGIFLSSSVSVIIDPFASLLMGFAVPILTYLIEKFLSFILIKGYPIEGIIFSALGGIFDSIFAAGRTSRTPELCSNPVKQGGLQFASLIVSAVLAILFGLLATLILRCFNPRQSVNKDWMFWFIDQQNLPIYPDDPILRRLVGDDDKKLKQQSVLFNLRNAYITQKARQNVQKGKIIKQQVEQSRIR